MSAVFVPGRPAWSAGEPIEVQRLIVEHKLNQAQLRALCEYAADPVAPRTLAHSTAQALRNRGLGEITGKQNSSGLTRGHPKADFALSEAGRDLVAKLSAGVIR